jgi:hypothetical protein
MRRARGEFGADAASHARFSSEVHSHVAFLRPNQRARPMRIVSVLLVWSSFCGINDCLGCAVRGIITLTEASRKQIRGVLSAAI